MDSTKKPYHISNFTGPAGSVIEKRITVVRTDFHSGPRYTLQATTKFENGSSASGTYNNIVDLGAEVTLKALNKALGEGYIVTNPDEATALRRAVGLHIISTDYCQVEVEDADRYTSTVFLQGDGKWRCLRCNRYRCHHALFVKGVNPTLPPRPQLSTEDIEDILTY